MQKTFVILLMSAVSLLTLSCSGSRMIRTDVDQARVGDPIKNVLVIAVFDDEDVRETYETHFIDHLNTSGVKAWSTTHVLPVSVGRKLDKAEIVTLAEHYGCDTVAITHLVGQTESEAFSRAGRLSQIHHKGYYQYYTDVWDDVHAPTVFVDHIQVFLETRLYDVKTQRLIWSGESRARDPKTMGQAIGQVVSLVMDELKKKRLLPISK